MHKLLLYCFCIHIQRGPSFQIAVYICVCVLALDVMHVLRVFKKHNGVHFLFHVIILKRKMIMSLKSKSPVFCTIRLKYKESYLASDWQEAR